LLFSRYRNITKAFNVTQGNITLSSDLGTLIESLRPCKRICQDLLSIMLDITISPITARSAKKVELAGTSCQLSFAHYARGTIMREVIAPTSLFGMWLSNQGVDVTEFYSIR
jgi:hypothetical protein